MIPIKQIWHYIVDDLKEGIIAGRYKPGQRLREADLALKYSVSKTPVREALRYLASIGFVELVPNVGARVKNINVAEVKELFQIQIVLERLAVEEAITNLGKADYDRLEEYISQMKDCLQRKDYRGYEKANMDFHALIWERSGNKNLFKMLQNVYERLHKTRAVMRWQPEVSWAKVSEHRAILDALVKKDHDKAKELLSSHIEGFRKAIVAALKKEELASNVAPAVEK